METQYQNYKSDFVLRESFLDITGKVVPLPEGADFTLRYWVREGHAFECSRKGGVYQNCAPEGDTLLVFFKSHGLCEGKLHHELHLALDNEAFADGVQNVYYPAELNVLLWDRASSGEILHSGVLAAYTRGNAFTYDDFTPEQIEQLQKPARDAAALYEQKLEEYEQRAGEQVQNITESAEELHQLVTDFGNNSEEVLSDMQDAVERAKEIAEQAEQQAEQADEKAAAAIKAAQNAALAAKQAAELADGKAGDAEQARKAAALAIEDAKRATTAAIDAAKAAEKAKADADQAAKDAASIIEKAEKAAREALNAAGTYESATADGRKVIERAEAAIEAANKAKAEADTAAARAATNAESAARAATNAQLAKQAADAATAAATAAAQMAETVTQHTQQERAELLLLIERAKQIITGAPTGLRVQVPAQVTIGNPVAQFVRGTVLPVDAAQNMLYLSDGKAADVLPDGRILAKAEGTSTVHVIPTEGTKHYKTVEVAVVPPRMRLTSGGIRVDKKGNIRLT